MKSIFIFLLLHVGVQADFNFEVGQRIHERISSYMSTPPAILLQTDIFRSNGGFPADMRATDRNAFFRLNDAFMETYPQFQSIYYGLEDGVFAGHGFASKIANYREPGHSGYSVVDGESDGVGGASNPTMEKHYKACVNSTSGEKLPCKMKVGGKFTDCTAVANADEVDALGLDCVLEKCADESSQRDCEAVDESERALCLSNVKWCSSYVIKEAPANATLGFISRSTHCIDGSGIPTQTVGEVVMNDESLGNCYFNDGVTLVKRADEDDFAYCGGSGKICNDTFTGAYISRDYDPRWRGWYIATKAIQQPNWSPPYPFFTALETGITFSRPIYSMGDDGRNIFAGVLAVDYTFADITQFLQQSYKDSPIVVAIFEQSEPHYMIASSTGGSNSRTVLVDDNSKACPNPEKRDGKCEAVRIKASEMGGLISNAFMKQQEKGFLETELLAAKASDSNVLYATQSKSFSVKDMGGLEWTIMIMTPIETEGADQIVQGDMLFGALIAVASFGFSICALLVGLIIRNRTKRDFIVSDWRFLSAFVGGCALLNASCLTFLGPNTDALCLTRMWVVHWLVVFVLSLLFVKVYRMYKLVGAGARRHTISHAQAARMTLPLIILQTFILLIFTLVDPNKLQEEIKTEGSDISHRYICGHDTPAFFIVMMVVEGGLVLVGCVLAFQTRHLRTEFNESRQTILAMYDTAVIGSCFVLVSNVVVQYQGEQRMLFAIGIFWVTCFASAVFVIPRLMRDKHPSDNVRVSGVVLAGVQTSANFSTGRPQTTNDVTSSDGREATEGDDATGNSTETDADSDEYDKGFAAFLDILQSPPVPTDTAPQLHHRPNGG